MTAPTRLFAILLKSDIETKALIGFSYIWRLARRGSSDSVRSDLKQPIVRVQGLRRGGGEKDEVPAARQRIAGADEAVVLPEQGADAADQRRRAGIVLFLHSRIAAQSGRFPQAGETAERPAPDAVDGRKANEIMTAEGS